jgi:hypothetical protein
MLRAWDGHTPSRRMFSSCTSDARAWIRSCARTFVVVHFGTAETYDKGCFMSQHEAVSESPCQRRDKAGRLCDLPH